MPLVGRVKEISTHAPHAGSDLGRRKAVHALVISTHAPHAGSDMGSPQEGNRAKYFNPRSPCGERPAHGSAGALFFGFQPTLPMRGATVLHVALCGVLHISTHAPHAGSDLDGFLVSVLGDISTHAPHAGSDAGWRCSRSRRCNFNPRSPCGERPQAQGNLHRVTNFNPRSPCGERPSGIAAILANHISTHAPHAGSDEIRVPRPLQPSIFQPTLPMRGATLSTSSQVYVEIDFNPRSPCGERPVCIVPLAVDSLFQPTLPMRGATTSPCPLISST